uniref:Uncharacterized protein n=1 Tax=uncultured bacterium contig00092 TaxID=1181563 RepID=A0A806K2Z1_9BACT|nr:hypothetical protein [uncultured bacterium contig00092]
MGSSAVLANHASVSRLMNDLRNSMPVLSNYTPLAMEMAEQDGFHAAFGR